MLLGLTSLRLTLIIQAAALIFLLFPNLFGSIFCCSFRLFLFGLQSFFVLYAVILFLLRLSGLVLVFLRSVRFVCVIFLLFVVFLLIILLLRILLIGSLIILLFLLIVVRFFVFLFSAVALVGEHLKASEIRNNGVKGHIFGYCNLDFSVLCSNTEESLLRHIDNFIGDLVGFIGIFAVCDSDGFFHGLRCYHVCFCHFFTLY